MKKILEYDRSNMLQNKNSIKEHLKNLIIKYGFGKELEALEVRKNSSQTTSSQFQLDIEVLASKLPLTPEEIEELLKLFESNIEDLVETPMIIGNGDIKDLSDLRAKGELYNWDGGMIGRGIFENPFAFSPELMKASNISILDRVKLLEYHLNLWVEIWGETKNYQALKKFFKIYISGFDGAVALRASLMETSNPWEAFTILDGALDTIFGN